MKLQKVLFSLICVVAILLAIPFSSSAIGFTAEDKYESVFVITSGNSLGSGFSVGENCIITNAHVLGDPNNIVLTTYTGETYKANVIGCDYDKDIAALSVNGANFTPIKIADYNTLNAGDDVYAIGTPKSMAYTITKGVVSAKEREIDKNKYIQTDAAINEGNSGGPLLNDEGNVIGINTLKLMDSEGIGLAIPMTVTCAFLKSIGIELDENGNVTENIEPKNNNKITDKPTGKNDNNTQTELTQKPHLIKILIIALCVSAIGNIVLLILLVFQNKKNLNLKYDPRERTDFDIDILE